MRERERGGGRLDVEIETAGEGVKVRQVSGPCAGDSLQELVLVGRGGDELGAEGPGRAGQGFHLSRRAARKLPGGEGVETHPEREPVQNPSREDVKDQVRPIRQESSEA